MDAGGGSVKIALNEDGTVERFVVKRGMNLTSVSKSDIWEILVKIRSKVGDVDLIRIAASGGSDERRREKLEEVLRKVFPNSSYEIMGDIEAVVRICPDVEPAVVVISGTGSSVVSTSGKRKGGWGHLFDDEGSSFSIALRIFRGAFEYFDGLREHDEVFDELLNFYKVKGFEELVNIQMEKDFKERIASFVSGMPWTPFVEMVVDDEMGKLAKRTSLLAEEENAKVIYMFGGVFSSERIFEIFKEKLSGFKVEKCEKSIEEELSKG